MEKNKKAPKRPPDFKNYIQKEQEEKNINLFRKNDKWGPTFCSLFFILKNQKGTSRFFHYNLGPHVIFVIIKMKR